MLKLKKVYIENFKGISSTRIINFNSSDLSILNGPNGFGKTTVFDAIELCLSGKLERTMQFSNVQKNTQNYRKPFYQNTAGKNVVLKLLFEDSDNGSLHTIIKFLDKDHNGKIGNSKSFRPDAWGILDTYYSTDDSLFESELNTSVTEKISQLQIDKLFFDDQSYSQANLYPLFNYLQQEENIYFLKKDEEEKKAELDFLFQTQEEAKELERLTKICRELKSIQDGLSEKISLLGESANSGETQVYLRLIPSKELVYDVEQPFKDISSDNLPEVYNAYQKELLILEEFIAAFDPEEYQLDKLREAVVYAIDNDQILTAFLLQSLNQGKSFEVLQELSAKISLYNNHIESLQHNQFEVDVLKQLNFSQEFIDSYRASIADSATQERNIGEIGRIISDLNQARNSTLSKSRELPAEFHDADNCPLCNTSFSSFETLEVAVHAKTQALLSFNREQLINFETSKQDITTNFRLPVEERITAFLNAEENHLDKDFYTLLLEYRGFTDRIRRFQAILTQGKLNFDEFIITKPVSINIFRELLEKLKAALMGALAKIVPDQNKLIHKEIFKDVFVEDVNSLISLAEVKNKQLYVEYKYNEARLYSLNILAERLVKFKELEVKTSRIKSSLSLSIKRYKMEMIEKIKIPFYLYSGKILQNYQQGLGIFIDMQENTSRIKFLTDDESDHDIIHHLSSGQLAVVSIAFCLALNKVYETANHFKFLAIDDPVQTLDDINIHSFIELMRHDFSDYQIIMSTHEDDIASYLSYKFQKFHFNCNTIKVQRIFYGE
ncbi:AAA family ATPase [Flavobacterium zepuense]|uniref:AAA family ATPase n=1 Tax=Flavobacterium zepuense TaxID=2593302 RepID=A0A552UUV5_9FLAO|nr:AAA family ATPase [Flavobacterium zepuense]TRW21975.1 AAA family ATPase [Flavobacterium zepuense]